MKKFGRKSLKIVFWVAWLGLLLFIAVELWFRAFPQNLPLRVCRAAPAISMAFCQPQYRYDDPPILGYTFTPGYVYEGSWNPADPAIVQAEDEFCRPLPNQIFQHALRVDDKGFINATPWQDRYDIVVTGDSFTVPFAPTFWIDELSALTGMSVLPLGVNGWGPLSEVEAVRMYGLDKNPDWVILVYFEGNDLFNVEQYQVRREAGLSWPDYAMAQTPLLERFIVPNLLRVGWESLGSDQRAHLCRYPMTVSSNFHQFETIFFHIHIAALSAERRAIEASESWALVTEAILALKHDVEAVGGRFLLVYAPAKEHLYWGRLWEGNDLDNFLALTSPQRSFEEFSRTVDAQMLLMESFAAKHDINFLNLTGVLWEHFTQGAELYHYADVHWNAAGNALVAEVVADYLLAAVREGFSIVH